MSSRDSFRIATIVGARPQFIKAGVLSRALKALPSVEEILIHTGQHYDPSLSDVFFAELNLDPPQYHLAVGSGTHGVQTARLLEAIEGVLLREAFDLVLVFGDTNSTLAAALAAAKLGIPIAHVEAGLRSHNRRMPEETNRILTDHLSEILFAPTSAAVSNLRREGIQERRIHQVGDVMLDQARLMVDRAANCSTILKRLDLESQGYVLATIHRAENTDDPGRLTAILEGLALVADSIPVVMPVHPRTRKRLEGQQELSRALGRLRAVDPLSYLDMLQLVREAALVATDSGGVQKEAFFHRVPCVTLRDETEWVELVECGWNRLQPPVSVEAVSGGILAGLCSPRGPVPDLYGDGHAGIRIAELILHFLRSGGE